MTKTFTTSKSFEDYLRMYNPKSNGDSVQLLLSCSKCCGDILTETYSPTVLNILSVLIKSEPVSIPDYICPSCRGIQ